MRKCLLNCHLFKVIYTQISKYRKTNQTMSTSFRLKNSHHQRDKLERGSFLYSYPLMVLLTCLLFSTRLLDSRSLCSLSSHSKSASLVWKMSTLPRDCAIQLGVCVCVCSLHSSILFGTRDRL